MKKTFECNESMIITIPIGNLNRAGAGPLLPDTFKCVFKDFYKVFVTRGKPKPLGAAQAISGVFIFTLGLITRDPLNMIHTLPSILFVVVGLLSYAAGKAPRMHVAKLSLSVNIISFFWSVAAFSMSVVNFPEQQNGLPKGVLGLEMSLLFVENLAALFLIYWLSKAVCRKQFNTLPIILLKQEA